MSELIKQFEGQDVRIIDRNGNPWFVARDVCNILGYVSVNDAISYHCEKGVGDFDTLYVDTTGGKQPVSIISELNVNRLIMRSKKPEAVRFQNWVCGEVIPLIQRTGSYSMSPQTSQLIPKPIEPDVVIQLANEIKRERAETERVRQDIYADWDRKSDYVNMLIKEISRLTTMIITINNYENCIPEDWGMMATQLPLGALGITKENVELVPRPDVYSFTAEQLKEHKKNDRLAFCSGCSRDHDVYLLTQDNKLLTEANKRLETQLQQERNKSEYYIKENNQFRKRTGLMKGKR